MVDYMKDYKETSVSDVVRQQVVQQLYDLYQKRDIVVVDAFTYKEFIERERDSFFHKGKHSQLEVWLNIIPPLSYEGVVGYRNYSHTYHPQEMEAMMKEIEAIPLPQERRKRQ